MNVLVLAPHPDDESLGCGGALCLHAQRGDAITVIYLTSGELGLKKLPREEAWRIRESEARRAAEILGIQRIHFLRGPDWHLGDEIAKAADGVLPILKGAAPELVYLPHPGEWHPDHKAALPILHTAWQQTGLAMPKLRTYEIWTPFSEFTELEDISPVMARKLEAVRAHRSQLEQLAYDRAIEGLNSYRGAIAGHTYAEAFHA